MATCPKSATLFVCVVSMVAFSNFAQAAFIDRGGGMIYDDVLDITWLQDANYAMTSGFDTDGLMDWDMAETWASTLSVGGHNNWRLPTHDPSNPRPVIPTLDNEIGSLWSQLNGGSDITGATDISPFQNLPLQTGGSEWYWTGLENDISTAWRISMNCACWDFQAKDAEFYAWAVRTGDVAVSEPSTLWLLGASLIGFGLTKRRRAAT